MITPFQNIAVLKSQLIAIAFAGNLDETRKIARELRTASPDEELTCEFRHQLALAAVQSGKDDIWDATEAFVTPPETLLPAQWVHLYTTAAPSSPRSLRRRILQAAGPMLAAEKEAFYEESKGETIASSLAIGG
ncbi:MAG: hypothetical protein COY40_04580 [Alphaproteobacteria bacterium CG_4_10_14_0_8_um_filter_53_9]|nr:MAG: hypothetical protein COY40_04580 [Alphaproteobacteria bacterium CG_4_10_14_0_8_um_filter_53_9]